MCPRDDLAATGSDDGELKLWKIAADFKSISLVFTYEVTGFINDVRFSVDGSLIAIAAGQEHREGRWWVEKEARNQVIVLPVHYGDDKKDEESRIRNGDESTANMSDSDDEQD
ncbi:hypothetical protein ANCCAN_10450 [Ancylostoma caninum]|uniref:Uncharacterized protein n=1 Tax=Ancylostoma caninum TaxID=29170 RepID=A0A368GGP6_ANCCA|nr:hypothetical protein ANCCAN_10450 [Ancylostoma caninum]